MKHYDIEITDKAHDDMDRIYTYIAEELHEPVVAANKYDKIADAILSLEIMPDRIKIMDSEPAHSQGLRPLLVDNYTVLYVIEDDTVLVVRVFIVLRISANVWPLNSTIHNILGKFLKCFCLFS